MCSTPILVSEVGRRNKKFCLFALAKPGQIAYTLQAGQWGGGLAESRFW